MRQRVRDALGVWAPMVVGLFLIAGATNFLLTVRGSAGTPLFPLDPVGGIACGGGVIVVGIVLLFSTYGRWRKVQRARTP